MGIQAISHLPALSIPSSADAASSIVGGSFYIQLYNVLQTNMLQRVNPAPTGTHKRKKGITNSMNEKPALLMLVSLSLAGTDTSCDEADIWFRFRFTCLHVKSLSISIIYIIGRQIHGKLTF
jgi:hypothetical protein